MKPRSLTPSINTLTHLNTPRNLIVKWLKAKDSNDLKNSMKNENSPASKEYY